MAGKIFCRSFGDIYLQTLMDSNQLIWIVALMHCSRAESSLAEIRSFHYLSRSYDPLRCYQIHGYSSFVQIILLLPISSAVNFLPAKGNGSLRGSLNQSKSRSGEYFLISQKSSLDPCCRNRATFSAFRRPIAIFASRGVILFVPMQNRNSCQYGTGERRTP